jgi:asparagine synthase (glutamine-hydrolysing)
MCGITGFIELNDCDREPRLETLARMNSRLAHRGPDDGGVWSDPANGVYLGHRRLSILDVSSLGHQPMASACGRYILVYNGELYNFRDLRKTLESLGRRFRGHSDTEVLVEAIAQWGIPDVLQRLNGMFALAVWDRHARRLVLARDAVGIKPLYYGWGRECLLFASELKSLREHPSFSGSINREALTQFLRHGYIPAPHSIYQDIYKLPPGCWVSLTLPIRSRDIEPSAWWCLDDAVSQGAAEPFSGTPQEAIAELDRLLRDAVGLQMVSDVPLGALLSGGIDSSTVVALMQAQSDRPIRTFTIGFAEQPYNEADFARAVAEHLGTEHTECYVTSAEARELIPQLPQWYDEPFADSSQIPTVLLARMVRHDVSVCLSGDGGDELFCGYDRYGVMQRRWRVIGSWPRRFRQMVSRTATSLALCLPAGTARRKLRTLAEFAGLRDALHLYTRFNTHWRDADTLVVREGEAARVAEDLPSIPAPIARRFRESMMYLDTRTYLPDDILVKVDRASMAVGLEVRVPLLDQRVVEFAWRLPLGLKVRSGQTKWILQQVLGRYVPSRLTDRPKMGFGVPIDAWLRGPLRDWAHALLDADRLRRQGFLRPEPVQEKWREHLSGRRNWQYLLWDVLMFQAWLDADSISARPAGKWVDR